MQHGGTVIKKNVIKKGPTASIWSREQSTKVISVAPTLSFMAVKRNSVSCIYPVKGSTSCIDQTLRYAPLGSGPSHHSQSHMALQTLAGANDSAFPLSFHATCNNRKLGGSHKLFPGDPKPLSLP